LRSVAGSICAIWVVASCLIRIAAPGESSSTRSKGTLKAVCIVVELVEARKISLDEA